MKVLIKKSIASSNFNYKEGEEVKLSKEQAEEFIEYAIAEPVKKAVKKTPAKKKGDKDANDG